MGSTAANGNTASAPVTSITSPSTSGSKSQQQILPWKLRESNPSTANVIPSTAEFKRACGVSGYERLVSADALTSSSAPSHSRTGSSPAMMQNIRVWEVSFCLCVTKKPVTLLVFFVGIIAFEWRTRRQRSGQNGTNQYVSENSREVSCLARFSFCGRERFS